ncbi:CsbD family protein [Methylobacterium sp. Leaf456]|uniref:CsbD family protein n=1 Tax=Methylobacterium sp. Leaf456 TaxID=1736382 RepID=UPI0009EC5FB0|nr:CsbD family protein [Methylobacterium sp. Leaf456]
MTEDRNPTAAEQLKGSIKEALGKLTGDAAIEAEGRRQKREARADKAVPRRDGPARD